MKSYKRFAALNLIVKHTSLWIVHGHHRRRAGGVIGGGAHCNGWNGVIGTEANVVSIGLIPFHLFHSSHYNEPVLL